MSKSISAIVYGFGERRLLYFKVNSKEIMIYAFLFIIVVL